MIVRGFVQAGGGSTRFGSDKGLAQFAGKSMLVRTAELVASVCEDVHLVAPAGRYADLGWPALVDRWPGEGPLGGILTALHYINAVAPPNGTSAAANGPGSLALIVSCDMPFLTQEFLAFLRERALASPAQVVVPQSSTGLEPLCACWRFSAVDAVQSAFDSGVRKVTEAMKRLPMEVLDELLWKRFDKGNRLFRNMNTPQDYAEARRIFEASEP
jgi:molybdopterin-guanine dinucleotide biosynthesis protein A